jgi:hypothetical protein
VHSFGLPFQVAPSYITPYDCELLVLAAFAAGATEPHAQWSRYPMSGVFDLKKSQDATSGTLHVIVVDPTKDQFFASVSVSWGDCLGDVAGFARLSSKTEIIITQLRRVDSEPVCKIRVRFGADFKSATVSEHHCFGWHGFRCGFNGTYQKVHG